MLCGHREQDAPQRPSPSTPSGGAPPTGLETPKPKTRSLYDGLLLVQERTSANTPVVTYTRGRDLSGSLAGAGGIGGLLARSHGYSGGNWSSHNAYHADGNGNVTALVNSAGALQARYRYDPYGRYLAGGGTLASANVLRFSSKPWVGFGGSATSGLYYYGYRFYDPYLQRWLNRDPKGERGDRNLYRYTANSPYRFFDPYGLDLISIPGGPPITPFPPIPKTPPQPLPTPPPPPGVNVPPPCAPYPECLFWYTEEGKCIMSGRQWLPLWKAAEYRNVTDCANDICISTEASLILGYIAIRVGTPVANWGIWTGLVVNRAGAYMACQKYDCY